MSVIDSHCHIGQGTRKSVFVEELLRQMDSLDVTRAVICTVDQYVAVYNREGNDEVIAAIRNWPDRFWGLAAVNPWFGDRGVEELSRCFNEGLVGLKLNSHLQGFVLSEPLVHPLIEICQRNNGVVYAHTGTPITAEPFQLAELARTFPEVPMVLGHMGFADYFYDAVHATLQSDNIYLETSLIDINNIANAIEKVGAERILFGSDYPESDLSLEIEKMAMIEMIDKQHQAIMHENAISLWGEQSR